MKIESIANTNDNRPKAKEEGGTDSPELDPPRKWICHSLSLSLQSWCPMQYCKCQLRQDKLAHCRWHQATQPQLAFSRASLPEETAQLYPPIKDFCWLTWHCRWIFCVRMCIIICKITLIFHACLSLVPAWFKLCLQCF